MWRDKSNWLPVTATVLILIAIIAGIVSSHWKHEALPLYALAIVLLLTVIKVRIVILDFMGLRHANPKLSTALVVWPLAFVTAVALKAVAETYFA